jgi:hypothetical protein
MGDLKVLACDEFNGFAVARCCRDNVADNEEETTDERSEFIKETKEMIRTFSRSVDV